MAISIVIVYIVVVVFPIFSSGVVGWIYVDTVDLALVKVKEQLEGMIVLALDHHVMGRGRVATFHGTEMLKSRIDRFAETRDRSQFRDVNSFSVFAVF